MTANIRATVAELRDQLTTIAEQLGPYAPPARPSTIYRARGDEQRHGPIWNIRPGNDRRTEQHLSVRALDNDEAPRCVYIAGCEFSYGDDWTAVTTSEAREFAMALLAAADWADDADPLLKRRTRQEAS